MDNYIRKKVFHFKKCIKGGKMNFSVSLMVSKAVMVAVRAAIAFVGADQLSNWGVSVNEAVLVAGIMGLIEAGRNALKVKYADKLGFFKFILN